MTTRNRIIRWATIAAGALLISGMGGYSLTASSVAAPPSTAPPPAPLHVPTQASVNTWEIPYQAGNITVTGHDHSISAMQQVTLDFGGGDVTSYFSHVQTQNNFISVNKNKENAGTLKIIFEYWDYVSTSPPTWSAAPYSSMLGAVPGGHSGGGHNTGGPPPPPGHFDAEIVVLLPGHP